MAEKNKSYRIRTTVGRETDSFLDVHLDQDYESLEILSLKISDKDTYKLHNSDYGVIVGRVLANGNFGVPNAKISVFIPADEQNSNLEMWNLYTYTSTSTKNENDIRYNLLPDESVKDCHKAVGTFPHKTFLLENDALLEVFDKYYLYTTRTNNAGDYLICGVPTGMQTLHMDLDLSDCGILSQRPRDFVYKGYTIEQFDNPNQFKKDENLDSLAQIFSQDQPVYVQPFWGNEDNGETIGITRADIQISFKFEPTCVFMGSAISDNASNGVGKKCVPTNQMGAMDELTAGEGTIEMIRKTPGGHVEEFAIKGNQLINGNGVWCYQIPMNLDYMMTDEYGHMVPTDDPEKGIPTRARVRFRASLTDMDGSSQSYYRAKYLIPNNPGVDEKTVDYNFGTYTEERSYRDLFWNGVYTVKSYIPRFQKSKRWRSERFSGIKGCNYYGNNNPMPYNNMRIRLPFMFTVLCIFVKLFIKIVTLVNRIVAGVLRIIIGVFELVLSPIKLIGTIISKIPLVRGFGKKIVDWVNDTINWAINSFVKKYGIHCTYIGDGLCPDMEGWYFAPGCGSGLKNKNQAIKDALLMNTLAAATDTGESLEEADDDTKESLSSTEFIDETSTDSQNISASEKESACVTVDVDYLMNCFEMNLAQEYRVIKFDFYNDWVNGVLFFPRWMRKVKRKKKYKFSLKNGISTYYKDKVQGCMNAETSRVKKSRYYTQQCSLEYKQEPNKPWTEIKTNKSCFRSNSIAGAINSMAGVDVVPSKCHKKPGMDQSAIFGKKSGLVTEETTMLGQYVYYLKPCEWKSTTNGDSRTLLFATDLVLLGTLNDCDENGIPQAFKYLNNSSYIMPTNLALTTMDDDAYIYTNDGGTVCSSGAKTTGGIQGSVKRVTPDFQSTNCAYTKTESDQVDYGESDDPIPVTESAGITWNYSGPGQDDVESGLLEKPGKLLQRLFGGGNKRYKYLYYPGGHFLSLSCVNSDSNIKSCVNLKRICELGATMSQRREEVRGYDDNGNPTFRYYVPTGLISNVDIESAAFRSMFATLNHNKLVATEKNETTGYKKYNFRFLRPDGFDGSLAKYVHDTGSPYNKVVNERPEDNFLTDASDFFRKISLGLWEEPLDYDKYETKYTERRTVEDSIDDYYMFRFGLNSFANNEQRKHFLLYNGGAYSMPQYENSFYFYFGLRDGSTALDEFKKQFFSECQSNNIVKTPTLTVKEKINPDNLEGSASVIIDNMVAPYTYTLKDNTQANSGQQTGDDKIGPYTTDNDIINFVSGKTPTEQFSGFTIGHEYTITVTDSLDNTVSKTFTFGASAVKVDLQMIHFRTKGNGPTNDPRKGGYVKINDAVTILKKGFKISEDNISFAYKLVSDTTWSDFSNSRNYVDEGGDTWYLYYLPKTGVYEIALKYNGNIVSIYTAAMEDNTKVNLFVSCDYLAYKPEYNVLEEAYNPCCNNGNGLKDYSESDLYNGAPFQGIPEEKWLMRHSYYRQTANDNLAYDNYIYTKGKYEIAIFGQPEKGSNIPTAELNGRAYDREHNPSDRPNSYSNNYDQFAGYVVDDTYTFIPTMYYDWQPEVAKGEGPNTYRNAFDAMSYSSDGRAAADALNASITEYEYDNGKITLTFTDNSGKLIRGHGAVVVFENGMIVFPVISGGGQMIAFDYDVYPNRGLLPGGETGAVFTNLLGMATIYPTLRVPSMYKPFYGIVSAATWCIQDLTLTTDDNGEAVLERNDLPLSYKVEGNVYNGLTLADSFARGETNNAYGVTFDTYLIFKDSPRFWEGLRPPSRGGLVYEIQTSSDHVPKRKIEFGRREEMTTEKQNDKLWPLKYDNICDGDNPSDRWQTDNEEFAFGRQIVSPVCAETGENIKDFSTIEYAIKENIGSNLPNNVYTERYDGGKIDQALLKDSCSIANEFHKGLKLKAFDGNPGGGINGQCTIFTDEALPSKQTELFLSTTQMFDVGPGPMYLDDSNERFYYGAYNENIKYDQKGKAIAVRRVSGLGGDSYQFSMTQENGAKIKKKVPIGPVVWQTQPEQRNAKMKGESDLYNSGVTLYHRYTLKKKYRRDIKSIGDEVASATPATVTVLQKNGTIFQGTEYKTLIARYIKPDDRTKNKLTVYRLYPIEAFDIIYPANEGGIEPYLQANSGNTYSKEAQTITITISTNVKFSGSTGANWVKFVSTSSTASGVFDSTVTSISLQIDAIPNSDNNDRCTTVSLSCVEPGVEITPETRDRLTASIEICQTKDEIKEVKEELEEDMQNMYTDLEGQIRELSGNTGNGGTSGGGD